jgi:hypothetical protein
MTDLFWIICEFMVFSTGWGTLVASLTCLRDMEVEHQIGGITVAKAITSVKVLSNLELRDDCLGCDSALIILIADHPDVTVLAQLVPHEFQTIQKSVPASIPYPTMPTA